MKEERKVLFLIAVAALGYFVDIYDLVTKCYRLRKGRSR
jgi:hypothetical protein